TEYTNEAALGVEGVLEESPKRIAPTFEIGAMSKLYNGFELLRPTKHALPILTALLAPIVTLAPKAIQFVKAPLDVAISPINVALEALVQPFPAESPTNTLCEFPVVKLVPAFVPIATQ